MGITIRHDPDAGTMYRVARRAGAAEEMDKRRREQMQQAQFDAELAARKAAQAAGFQQQKEMFGLEKEAREETREDVQAHEREGWGEQAKRAEQAQKFQQQMAIDADKRRQAAEARTMERAEDQRYAQQMQEAGYADDAQNFMGLVAQRNRKLGEIERMREADPEYVDVMREELIQLEEKITGYRENSAKYKTLTPEERAMKDQVPYYRFPNGKVGPWPGDSDLPKGAEFIGTYSVSKGAISWHKGDKKETEEKKLAEQAAADDKSHNLAVQQWNKANEDWRDEVASLEKSMRDTLRAQKPLPKPKGQETPEQFEAREQEWLAKFDNIPAEARRQAGRKPPYPEHPREARRRQELAPRQPGELTIGSLKEAAGETGGGAPAPPASPAEPPPTPAGTPKAQVKPEQQQMISAIVAEKRMPLPKEMRALLDSGLTLEQIAELLRSAGIS